MRRSIHQPRAVLGMIAALVAMTGLGVRAHDPVVTACCGVLTVAMVLRVLAELVPDVVAPASASRAFRIVVPNGLVAAIAIVAFAQHNALLGTCLLAAAVFGGVAAWKREHGDIASAQRPRFLQGAAFVATGLVLLSVAPPIAIVAVLGGVSTAIGARKTLA